MLHRIAASEVHLSDKLMTARAHLICSDDCPLAWLEREPDAEECKILLDKIAQIKKLDLRAGIRVLLAAISKADHVTNRVSNAQRAFLKALVALDGRVEHQNQVAPPSIRQDRDQQGQRREIRSLTEWTGEFHDSYQTEKPSTAFRSLLAEVARRAPPDT